MSSSASLSELKWLMDISGRNFCFIRCNDSLRNFCTKLSTYFWNSYHVKLGEEVPNCLTVELKKSGAKRYRLIPLLAIPIHADPFSSFKSINRDRETVRLNSSHSLSKDPLP